MIEYMERVPNLSKSVINISLYKQTLKIDLHNLPWFSTYSLILSPPNKLSSAKFLVCFNFQSASMSLKVGENV